jgi:hypothetical protein
MSKSLRPVGKCFCRDTYIGARVLHVVCCVFAGTAYFQGCVRASKSAISSGARERDTGLTRRIHYACKYHTLHWEIQGSRPSSNMEVCWRIEASSWNRSIGVQLDLVAWVILNGLLDERTHTDRSDGDQRS